MIYWIIGLALSSLFGTKSLNAEPNPAKTDWLEVEIGVIGTASEDILKGALQTVTKEHLSGLLIRLDTPGGALENTRNMVKDIMGAPFPVVVWVGPAGSRAGSAGAFITLAAHIAAMAPGANIGAAHPIESSGKDIEAGEAKRKIENDTLAFMESIARTRGRNVDMSRSFVANSLSVTAEEALENKVIDILAADRSTLFELIDGRKILLQDGSEHILKSKGAEFKTYEKSLRQRFLEILSNPNLFYLLFVAGLIGLGFELTHPGAILPGVAGAICLVLALIAESVLPVSFGAMILLVASVAFMIGEIFLPSFGVLGIGGFIGFVIGSILLVDPSNEQGLRVSLLAIIPGALTIAAFGFLVSFLVVRNYRRKIVSGTEGMIGARAKVLYDFQNGSGRVQINGEDWAATAVPFHNFIAGDSVRVDAIDGLCLSVSQGTKV